MKFSFFAEAQENKHFIRFISDGLDRRGELQTAIVTYTNISGTKIDYVGVKAATAVDFRGDNITNFESLEKNSIDLYAATKSLYLQNRDKKILNLAGGALV